MALSGPKALKSGRDGDHLGQNAALTFQRLGRFMHDAAYFQTLKTAMGHWAADLGFAAMGVTDTQLGQYTPAQEAWLDADYAGSMTCLKEQQPLRAAPELLVPGTLRVVSLRLDYLPPGGAGLELLSQGRRAYIARYALGRDYHKQVRKRIAQLGDRMRDHVLAHLGPRPLQYRAFVDSAPISERPLAEKAGLGWIGKNSLVLHPKAGSFFFLGELFTNLPLPLDAPIGSQHCGSCTRCLDVCPTQAFSAPYVLDARRCISYLTIENKGPIPEEFRRAMGNRIFGCDDCQSFCPWNKFAQKSPLADLLPREPFDGGDLLELFLWDEATFLARTQGMALRRLAYPLWLRNLAIALGNAPADPAIIAALAAKRGQVEPWLAEHFDWAIVEQEAKLARGPGSPGEPS